jgi:hypothetical protein
MKKLNLYQDKNGILHFYRNKNTEYKLIEIEYDETAPCKICNLPVREASMSGTDICPSCDCGRFRNGEKWDVYPSKPYLNLFRQRAKEKARYHLNSYPGYAGDLPGEGGGDGGYYEG